MKLTEKQVVFYNAEKDGFLEKYKDKEVVIFKSREEANLYLENL